jgi:hypothetical protein
VVRPSTEPPAEAPTEPRASADRRGPRGPRPRWTGAQLLHLAPDPSDAHT